MSSSSPTSKDAALVLFSGGQDSTTCLAWALERYARVETIGFDYGQRHRVELDCRSAIRDKLCSEFPKWAQNLGPDHTVELGYLSALGETAMTHDVEIELSDTGLPNTFVPARNLAFLTAAGAVAYRRSISVLVGGMCETDYSGYPDCRRDTIDAQEQTLTLGMDKAIRIETPLMRIDKAQTWALADDLGGETLTELVTEYTHTCYKGDRNKRHVWGYGCGDCPACELRANGYTRFKAAA